MKLFLNKFFCLYKDMYEVYVSFRRYFMTIQIWKECLKIKFNIKNSAYIRFDQPTARNNSNSLAQIWFNLYYWQIKNSEIDTILSYDYNIFQPTTYKCFQKLYFIDIINKFYKRSFLNTYKNDKSPLWHTNPTHHIIIV